MNIKLSNIREYLRASLWFIPVLMSGLGVGAAFLMLHFDETLELSDEMTKDLWLYAGGSENAREILSTISGSMIQVAGVVFSITIVVLSLSSSQFGPRLLRTFMKDWSTQLVLGSFVATYIYCLVVLRNVITRDDREVIPNLSIAFAIILTIVNILVLIHFIHHVATSIQADNVIDRVDRELGDGVMKLFPEELGEGEDEQNGAEIFDLQRYPFTSEITLKKDGYLQALDNDRLWELACKKDLLLKVLRRPGQYITARSTVCMVHSDKEISAEIKKGLRGCFIVGYQRTPEQDVEFSMDQLVEVALRALSPSLNDPFTAMACIDRLCSAMSVLAERRFPSAYRYTDDGILRMITHEPITFPLLFSTAFDRIRLAAGDNVPVMIRLLKALSTLYGHCRTASQRYEVMAQAGMVMRACERRINEPQDLEVARRSMPAP